MLEASPNFQLASPAVQHAVTDDLRQSQINPQRGSSKNSNSALYLENKCLSALLRPPMSDNQFDRNPAERQSGSHILFSRVRASRSTLEATVSLVSLGLVAPVATTAAWLEESLNELKECSTYALDEGLEEPSEIGLKKAEKLLETVSARITDRPDIYPMEEGSIAIDFRNPESRSGVLFLVEQDGSGALFHRTKNSKGRLRVDDAADLLQEGGFLELKRVGIR